MAISTYAELLQAVVRWGNRPEFTDRATDAIPLAEAKINRRLRTTNQETKNATFTIDGEYIALPTSFGGVRTLYLNRTPKVELTHMPDSIMERDLSSATGMPLYFNVQGSNFRFAPVPNATYSATLVYFLKVPALTSAATTNWLLTSHPDAYLYGVLAELFDFAGDSEKCMSYTARMYQVLDDIKTQSDRDRIGPSPQIRLA